MMQRNCVFCRIIQQDLRPTDHDPVMVASYPHAIAFVPLNPVTPGHTLVVPKEHVPDALQSPIITGRVTETAARLADVLPADSWNIITSVGSAATQTVHHLHIHLVPRQEGDGLLLPWSEP